MSKSIETLCEEPTLEGFIDSDILERFKGSSVFYGDIINAQLIKTNRELINLIKAQKYLK